MIVSDISTDPLWADFRDLAARHGLRACWSTPILASTGAVLGTFALYYDHPRTPEAEDEATISILTRTAALAIEHERAETALAESEERFRSLSRCAPLGVFMIDAAGAFSYVNPRFREMSGYDFERTFEFWLANAGGRPELARECLEAIATRQEYTHRFEIGPVNKTRAVVLRMAPMTSRTGSYIGYVGTLEDVSDRVSAQSPPAPAR